jgi:hypothetical protein
MNPSVNELAKYWYVYPDSNICALIYGSFGQQVVEYQESIRKRFRSYCSIKLNLSLDNLDDLISLYDKVNKKEVIPQSALIDITELEFVLSELFQSEVLKKSPEEILSNRFKWSFKNHLKHGDGLYDKSYMGTYIKYEQWYKK